MRTAKIETSALEVLYREEGDRLWWSLLAYSSDPDVASDAAAEAFAQALRRGEAIDDPRAWVWRVAFRLAAGELKRRRGTTPQLPETVSAPYDDRTIDIAEALAHLSTNQRATIVLHYYADRPVKEIATILGMNAATVRVHLHRGRRRLAKLLEDEHE
jgi:RNA polymerase sigma-70 factor (ECF subfamily)